MFLSKTPVAGLILSVSVLLLASCQQDPDPTPPASNCKLQKEYSYDSGSVDDSAIYTYTNNRVTKVETSYLYFTVEYANDKISRRNFYQPGTTVMNGHEIITYNSDGTINKVERFEDNGSNAVLWERMNFTYSGGKLVKVATVADDGTGTVAPYSDVNFQYTGNNVTKEVYTYFGSTPETDSITFQNDANPNYFTHQSTQFWLLDPNFLDAEAQALVFFLNQNNVTTVIDSYDPLSPIHYSYEADSHGNLIRFKEDGTLYLQYVYSCP